VTVLWFAGGSLNPAAGRATIDKFWVVDSELLVVVVPVALLLLVLIAG
jgi:hypothetical protein